jgi:hypothetical protein
LRFRVNNGWAGEIQPTSGNLFLGLGAGKTNTGGILNTAIGSGALANNTNSNNNVALGDSSLFSQNGPVNTGVNTAVGTHSLYKNTNGLPIQPWEVTLFIVMLTEVSIHPSV